MNKRTLIFIEDGSFSYDNRIIREADALVDSGWDVTVISPKYSDDPFYKKASNRLRAYYYPKPNAVSVIGHFAEHTFSMIFGSLFSFWVYIRHGFSVFQICNPLDILWIIAFPYKLIGKKIIFDQHDLCPEVYLSRGEGNTGSLFYNLLRLLEKATYIISDIVITTNESYKQTAINRGKKNPEDVYVVRNGPDLNKFRKTPPYKGFKRDGEVLIGYLGNMGISDGLIYLLEAANEIKKIRKRSDIKFVLVGGGPCQHQLQRQSKEMGLSDNVQFTGRISDNEMLAILNACDIGVQPDPKDPLNDLSTMNKVMEYMALEKPVIAFDLKETRVSCRDAALYVTPNDPVEFAEKIIYLADHPEIRIRMGKIGRERIEKKLAWHYSIPQLIKAYERFDDI